LCRALATPLMAKRNDERPGPKLRRLAEGVLGGDREGVRVIPAGERRGSLVPEDRGGAAVGGQRFTQFGE